MAEKKYIINNPTLMAEWDWDKNNELNLIPEKLTLCSNKKAWWKCHKGHEWQAVINSRNNGRSCPFCLNKKVLSGFNDLSTTNPLLAQEWNYEKNGELKPEHVTLGSNKKVWWKCHKEHEWEAVIYSRKNGNKCPFCSGYKILVGYNDLATKNPELAKEWNYEKNGELKPEEFASGSDEKVWWKCRKGHEWRAVISSRHSGVGCPICDSERHTSFPEFAIEYYLKKYEIDVIHPYKEKGYELDIYIPSKKIAIEYDGYLWHKGKEKKDLAKNLKCKNDGIILYRLREGLQVLNDTSIDYIVDRNQKNLSEVIKKILLEIIGVDIEIDIERDSIEIEKLRKYNEKTNSLLLLRPALSKEWNTKKNGGLKPEYVFSSSHKKVWWICKKGHEWRASIAKRSGGQGCPICSGKQVLMGCNDLAMVNPPLAKEWNYEKNGDLTPKDITAGSDKKVWWICDNGHEWQAKVFDRNRGKGCPYCSGKKILIGYNDLATTNPTLAREWNSEKNGKLTPKDVTAGSSKKVWWKCCNGHEWETTINNRKNGRSCPSCSKKRKK